LRAIPRVCYVATVSDARDRCGWSSVFPVFRGSPSRIIRDRLARFVGDASVEQVRAWDDSIPPLQREVGEVLACDSSASAYTILLEYALPLEARRPDVVLLVRGAVVVLELKGKERPSQADIDQVRAYARDLRCYHRACADRDVLAVVVPMRARGDLGYVGGVRVTGPDALDEFIERLQWGRDRSDVDLASFLDPEAYCPLPTIVEAARELFRERRVRHVERARASTQPAIDEITRICREAALTRTRRLVVVTGVPGAGKTLVGLSVAHAECLDGLAEPRPSGKPTAPAVFLSGNGPLVQVLQYELRKVGGGKTFVRHVKDYVEYYGADRQRVPPEHVLVFDEAQRAFDADMVARKHKGGVATESEPQHFVRFASRIPNWCVVVCLVGTGQEIHEGEEAGLVQWLHAVEAAPEPSEWQVHGPTELAAVFRDAGIPVARNDALTLDRELRFHLAPHLATFVESLLNGTDAPTCAGMAADLERDGYALRATRDLDAAKRYLRERYADDERARFGMLASSRDKDLPQFGIDNSWQATRLLRVGPWYAEGEAHPASCRRLTDVATEFSSQGLELDAVLLAWGTDLVWERHTWSNALARRYQRPARIRDARALRINAYRVLLTRGRDGTVVFVPPLRELDATWGRLVACGFRDLGGSF
jgi:hypothetical protein